MDSAENHYTADYPDDEVDSDDEYDRNAYHYRNKNASDDEEYDENDEEGDAMRYPWSKPKQPFRRGFKHDDEDTDGDSLQGGDAADTHDPLATLFNDLNTSEEKHEHQGVIL